MFGLTHGELVMAILTAIYVTLTGFYVWTSHKTLKAIERQAKHTEQQAEAGGKQFAEQIAEARKSADAAERTAKALINSEAASVMVSIEWALNRSNLFLSSGTGGDRTMIYIDYVCTNQGSTAAWITEKRFGFAIFDGMPPEPDMESIGCIQAEPDSVDAHQISRRPFDWEAIGHITPGKIPLIWGVVRYEDVFGGKRESRFGYIINPSRNLQRVALPAYNKRI